MLPIISVQPLPASSLRPAGVSVSLKVSRMAPSDIANPELAPLGKKRLLWADQDMPVLARVRDRFSKEKPLKGLRLSACLHVTAETANLCRTLQSGGALEAARTHTHKCHTIAMLGIHIRLDFEDIA